MAAHITQSSLPYSIVGYVSNVNGPYELAGHSGKKFIVFGFISPAKPPEQKHLHNCVFYLDLNHKNAPDMAANVARSLVNNKLRMKVSFSSPPDWNEETDPSYIIVDICSTRT
jgi:hypothetical protein